MAFMTKPSLRKNEEIKAQGRSDRIRQRETVEEGKRWEPIRPDGLVIRPRLIYHQEEGPVGPEGLP